MAISRMIRIASPYSPFVVPLALHAIGSSSTTLKRTIFASQSPFNHSHSFLSTATDRASIVANFRGILKQEIKSAKSEVKNFKVPSPTYLFPFEIEVDEYRELKLKRSYPDDDEEVIITINMSDVNTKGINSYYNTCFDYDSTKNDESKKESYKDDYHEIREEDIKEAAISIPMHIKVEKADGDKKLEFEITISAAEICIKEFSITNNENDYDVDSYAGPKLKGSLYKLQPYIYKYLEVRGINKNMASFLLYYLAKKKKEIELLALIQLKRDTRQSNIIS